MLFAVFIVGDDLDRESRHALSARPSGTLEWLPESDPLSAKAILTSGSIDASVTSISLMPWRTLLDATRTHLCYCRALGVHLCIRRLYSFHEPLKN